MKNIKAVVCATSAAAFLFSSVVFPSADFSSGAGPASCLAPWVRDISFKNTLGPGVVVDPDLVAPISGDGQFHAVMSDPENSNFFGGLFYAVRRYLETGDEGFRPVFLLQAMGGGADVASVIAQGIWMIDILCRQPDLAGLFERRFGEPLTREAFVRTRLVEFQLVVCPEKRLSHSGIYSDDLSAMSYQNAFFNGSRNRWGGAGTPAPIANALPVEPADGGPALELLWNATPETAFVSTLPDGQGGSRQVTGKPIEDVNMLPLARSVLGCDHITLLSMHGTIAQARDEFRRYLRHLLTRSASGGALPADGLRAHRPMFALYPDPGGDTWVRRNPFSTTTQQISPANEAYNALVAGVVFENNLNGAAAGGRFDVKALFSPMAFTADGESNGETANRAIDSLRQASAVGGVSVGMPPDILMQVIVGIFGGKAPLLTSHANLGALKRLLQLSVMRGTPELRAQVLRYLFGPEFVAGIPDDMSLDKLFSQLTAGDFLAYLNPMETLGEMPRNDVPVIKKESIVAGPATQLVMFLRPMPAYRYLLDVLELSPGEIPRMTYGQLRGRLENAHLVIGENQFPSFSEYEMVKALALLSPEVRRAVDRSPRRAWLLEQLSPKSVDLQNPFAVTPIIDDPETLLRMEPTDKFFVSIRTSLAAMFVFDSIGYVDETTGVLRMNPAYIRAYFKNYPEINACFEADPGLAQRLCDEMYRQFGEHMMQVLFFEFTNRSKFSGRIPSFDFTADLEAQLVEPTTHHLMPDVDVRYLSMLLKVLRINPQCNYMLIERLVTHDNNEEYPCYFEVARLQAALIQDRIERWTRSSHKRQRTKVFAFRLDQIKSLQELRAAIDYYRFLALDAGLDTGNYEKLIKSFSNLILLRMALGDTESAYRLMTILYFLMPANIAREVAELPFDDYTMIEKFMEMIEFLSQLRKGDRNFIDALNRLVLKAGGGVFNLGRTVAESPEGNFLLGFYIATTPEQSMNFIIRNMRLGGIDRQGLLETFVRKKMAEIELLDARLWSDRQLLADLEAKRRDSSALLADPAFHRAAADLWCGGDTAAVEPVIDRMREAPLDSTVRALQAIIRADEQALSEARVIFGEMVDLLFRDEILRAA